MVVDRDNVEIMMSGKLMYNLEFGSKGNKMEIILKDFEQAGIFHIFMMAEVCYYNLKEKV